MVPLLFASELLGIAALTIGAWFLGRRRTEPSWRGLANAVAAGIVLGALFDLLPQALEFAALLVGTILHSQVITRFDLAPDSFWAIGAGVLSEAVTPFGALLALFLYLSGNSAPMSIRGELVGRPGWRAWFRIPAIGRVDWRGVSLITIGLAEHNLWLGQVRGALASSSSQVLLFFAGAFGVIAALRAFALVGSLMEERGHWLALWGFALLIGAAGILGAASPDTRDSLVLGVGPLFLAALILPIALGRLLRRLEYDLGLGLKTTLMVLGGLGVERLLGYLLLLISQGQLG
jgi:hypothetical protein